MLPLKSNWDTQDTNKTNWDKSIKMLSTYKHDVSGLSIIDDKAFLAYFNNKYIYVCDLLTSGKPVIINGSGYVVHFLQLEPNLVLCAEYNDDNKKSGQFEFLSLKPIEKTGNLTKYKDEQIS